MANPRSTTGKKQEKSHDKALAAPFDQEGYEKNKSIIAITMGHFFLRYLNGLYQAFDSDLLMPIVLGEIAHHNIVNFYSRTGNCMALGNQIGNAADRMKNFKPSNAYSISEATGIPRETVRRKIDKLVKKGWLLKNDRGEVTISETVGEHFTKDFNKKLLSELLETSACINDILKSETGLARREQNNQQLACMNTDK